MRHRMWPAVLPLVSSWPSAGATVAPTPAALNARQAGLALLAFAIGCGDSGGSDGGDESTASGASTASTSTSPPTPTATSSVSADTTAAPGSSSGDGASSSSGGGGQTVVLQNDGWRDGQNGAFQLGFIQGECWASTYVPEPDQYPLTVEGAVMLVGGDNMTDAAFEVSVWEVAADGTPTNELVAGTEMISGVDARLDPVDFSLLFEPPVIAADNFAIALCLTAHDGAPAIASDADDTITAERNWIRPDGGGWVQSASLGVTGDWIMRAIVDVP